MTFICWYFRRSFRCRGNWIYKSGTVNSDGLTISKGVVVDGDILALAELDDPTNIDLSDVHKFNPSHDEIDTGLKMWRKRPEPNRK